MTFLFLLLLLIPPLDGQYVNSPIAHLSHSLKLKCDALPYRTAFIYSKCYFAVSEEVKYSEASNLCSSIFKGAEAASNVPTSVFNAMMLDKSKFHVSKDSSGKNFPSSGVKQSICIRESGYKCDVGEQSAVFPGKCIDVTDEKMDLDKARMVCKRKEMEFPSIGNELENRMIRDAIGKTPVWINNAYYYYVREPKWHRQKYFSKYSTCTRPGMEAGRETKCNMGQSSIVDNTGYWGNTWEKNTFAAVCVKDAENAFNKAKKTCAADNKLDGNSDLCYWTGPKDACVKTIDRYNRTGYVRMPYFPLQTWKEQHYADGVFENDLVNKVIVRRGCLYTGYNGYEDKWREIMEGSDNVGYGEYAVGGVGTIDGLSNLKCLCDPTEATLNDHVPSPPEDKKCIEHHEFNEETQQCEWIHDPKYCAELITYDGRKQMVEIPNWPKNKKYDVDRWADAAIKAENFHIQVTQVVVRQHCWVTMLTGSIVGWQNLISRKIRDQRQLQTSGYGKHLVKSHYNGKLNEPNDGAHRVICECIR